LRVWQQILPMSGPILKMLLNVSKFDKLSDSNIIRVLTLKETKLIVGPEVGIT